LRRIQQRQHRIHPGNHPVSRSVGLNQNPVFDMLTIARFAVYATYS
jgi:hypothetical protein